MLVNLGEGNGSNQPSVSITHSSSVWCVRPQNLSLSKSANIPDICLRLFLWRYNDDIQHRWWLGERGVKRFLPVRNH